MDGIVTADSGEAREQFHALAESLYGDASLRTRTTASLERDLFRDRQRAFVALENDRPLARVVARISPTLRDEQRHDLGLLGFFEAHDEPKAVTELLRAATAWLREQGCTTVIGPMDGDTWHRYRVNAGPFDRPPFLLEPTNPPYYAPLWDSAGFAPLEQYTSKRIDDIHPLMPHFEKKFAAAVAAGYSFEPIDAQNLRSELARIYDISLAIFRGNFLYTDISLEDFLALYHGIERLLDPRLVWFAKAPDGKDAGFFFAYADSAADTVNYKTLGVLPEHRRAGIGGALARCSYARALELGRVVANHCLMREGNVSAGMDAGHGVVFRRYLLYKAT